MEERFDRLEKKFDILTETIGAFGRDINDLTDIVVGVRDYLDNKIDTVEERLNSKIEGVQRSVDGIYELHGALEVRVTKLEAAALK